MYSAVGIIFSYKLIEGEENKRNIKLLMFWWLFQVPMLSSLYLNLTIPSLTLEYAATGFDLSITTQPRVLFGSMLLVTVGINLTAGVMVVLYNRYLASAASSSR